MTAIAPTIIALLLLASSGVSVDASLPSSLLSTSKATKINIRQSPRSSDDDDVTNRRHRSPSLSRRSSSPSSLGWNIKNSLLLTNIRGGAIAAIDSDEDELSENELSNLEIESDEEDDNDVDATTDDDEEHAATSSSSAAGGASGPPVKLSIKTALASQIIDQHLEFTASRKRTVLSLKQAISKTMRGRPPLSCIELRYHGRSLSDDEETIDDLLLDVDSDDEDESDDDDEDIIGEDEDEDTIKVSLTADIIPPIDTKFGIELREKIMKLSTKEILEAYCLNMAGMLYGQSLYEKECELFDKSMLMNVDGENDDELDEAMALAGSGSSENHSLNIRKKAAQLQKQFESTLSDETRQLISEEHDRVKKLTSSDGSNENESGEGSAEVVYGLVPQGKSGSSGSNARNNGRKGRTLKGGATMNVKRVLQRNLNVNWADTTRNSLLFLFFGYFGGRNSFSRTFLLLSSPLCFLIQTRPCKVAMKQLFYTIGEPPGILLSLLPAPQQAIMSLNYGHVMRGLYDEKKVLEGQEEWLEMERSEGNDDDDEIGGGLEFDDEEYDQYDNDEDDDDEYDSDDGC